MATTAFLTSWPQSAALFIQRSLPSLKWPEDAIAAWLVWFAEDQRAKLIVSDHIQGIALARCLRHITESSDLYCHHEDGPILWVDCLIGSADIIPAFCHMAFERFGHRPQIGFARPFRPRHSPRLHPFSFLTKIANKPTA